MGMFDLGSASGFFSSAAEFAAGEYFRDKSSDEATANRNFQSDMYGSRYQRTVQDLMAAGLNPMLAYQQGGGSAPGGSQAPQGSGSPRLAENVTTAAQADVMRATAEKLRAEKTEIEARTPTHGQQIAQSQQWIRQSDAEIHRMMADAAQREQLTAQSRQFVENLKQSVIESQEKIRLMQAQTGQATASAQQSIQQVENLKAQLPQIQATVQHLQALAQVSGAQVGLIASQIGKTDAETREIIQRVKENLPQIEAMIRDMEFGIKQASLPGHQRAGEVRGIPVLGHAAALLQMFNPLAYLFGR